MNINPFDELYRKLDNSSADLAKKAKVDQAQSVVNNQGMLDALGKGFKKYMDEPDKIVTDVVNAKNIKKVFESGAATIQGITEGKGIDFLTANPYVGEYASNIAKGMATNKKAAEKNERVNKLNYEASKVGKTEADKLNQGKQTGVSNWDILRNSVTETGAALMGMGGAGSALVEEGLERVGLTKEKKMAERLAENNQVVDRGKRALKNRDFLTNQDYNSLSPDLLKYLSPEEKNAIYHKINHPDIDLYEAMQTANANLEREGAVKLLTDKMNKGEITREEAEAALGAQDSAIGARRLTSDIVMDPLNLIDVAEVGVKVGSKIMSKGKNIAKGVSKIDDLPPVKIDEYDPSMAQKGLDEEADILSNPPTDKVPEMSQQSAPELIKQEQSEIVRQQDLLDKALDSEKITPEEYIQASEALSARKTENLVELKTAHGVEPEHVLKDPDIIAKETIQDIKHTNPGITNSDAVQEVARQTHVKQAEDIINRSDEIVKKFMSNEGLNPDPVMQDAILNKQPTMYTPPKTSINPKDGTLTADMGMMNPPPAQIQFTNSLQRLLFEFSVPFNKAIGQGMGWQDWQKYKESMQEIDKVVIKPLSKALFGDNPTPVQISRLKSNLGAIKSNIDKELTKMGNVPGRVINVGELPIVNDMINNLIKGEEALPPISRASDTDFYMPSTKAEDTVFAKLRGKANQEVEYLKNTHGLTDEEAMSFVASKPIAENSNSIRSTGITDGLTIAYNEGLMSAGEARAIEKASVLEHEKLHVSINHLYENGVGEVLESKLEKFESLLPLTVKKQYEGLFELLNPPSASEFLQELSAYTRQYRKAMEHPRGIEIVKAYEPLQYIHNNPNLKKALFKWDDMMKKQESLWEMERANIIRNSKMLKPGEIPTRKIDINSYTDNSSDHNAKLFDETNRQDRLKQLLGPNQRYEKGRVITYRGEDDLYTPKIQQNSEDAMLGQGHYSATNLNQASKYTGITGYDGVNALENGNKADLDKMTVNTEKSMRAGKNPQLYEEAVELEKPLFWDEKVKSDIMESFIDSKNPIIQGFQDYLSENGTFRFTQKAEDLMHGLDAFANDTGADMEELWKAFKKDILDPNGYDGMVSPPTDNDKVGMEIVNFNLHQVKRKSGRDKYGFGEYENVEKRKEGVLPPIGKYGDIESIDSAGNKVNRSVGNNKEENYYDEKGDNHYAGTTKYEKLLVSTLEAESENIIDNMVRGRNISTEDAYSVYKGSKPTFVDSNLKAGGLTQGINIVLNDGKYLENTKGLTKSDKKDIIQFTKDHEELHMSIFYLEEYSNRLGLKNDIYEDFLKFTDSQTDIVKSKLDKAKEILGLGGDTFMQELSAHYLNYTQRVENPRIAKLWSEDLLHSFFHENKDLREQMDKWLSHVRKGEELWKMERANIIRESRKIKPGEIPDRKIDIDSYQDNVSSLEAKQYDEANRQDLLKQVLGPEQMYDGRRIVTYRGEPGEFDPKIQYGSNKALYGYGHYSSVDFENPLNYSGVHNTTVENPKFYEESIELEKPLFADENVKLDIIKSFTETNNENLQNYFSMLTQYSKNGIKVEDMLGSFGDYAMEEGLDVEKFWKEFKSEILDPNGYDGVVSSSYPGSKPTINSFNLHQVKRRSGKDKFGFADYSNVEKRNSSNFKLGDTETPLDNTLKYSENADEKTHAIEQRFLGDVSSFTPKERSKVNLLYNELNSTSILDFTEKAIKAFDDYDTILKKPNGREILENDYSILGLIHRNYEDLRDLPHFVRYTKKFADKWKPGDFVEPIIKIKEYKEPSFSKEEIDIHNKIKNLDNLYNKGKLDFIEHLTKTYDLMEELKKIEGGTIPETTSKPIIEVPKSKSTPTNKPMIEVPKVIPSKTDKKPNIEKSKVIQDIGERQKRLQELVGDKVKAKKPLFWDEKPNTDILSSLAEAKDKKLQAFSNYLNSDPNFNSSGSIEDMIKAIGNYDSRGANAIWKAFKEEILIPNGYDKVVSPSLLGAKNKYDVSLLGIYEDLKILKRKE